MAIADKHDRPTTDQHFEKTVGEAAHNTTQDVGMDRQLPEQDCEIPEDSIISRMPIVFEAPPVGLE
jgi:hypothetical protein